MEFNDRVRKYLEEIGNRNDMFINGVMNKYCNQLIIDFNRLCEDEMCYLKFKDSVMDTYSDLDSLFDSSCNNSYFLLIIYSVISAYSYCKNYNDYCSVIDDVIGLDYDIDVRTPSVGCIISHDLGRTLLSVGNYKEMKNIRRYFKEILRRPNDFYFGAINNGLRMFGKGTDSYSIKVIDARIGNLIDRLKDKTIHELFYVPILLDGDDRFFYINNKLDMCDDNYRIKMDIFMYIGQFDKELFNELNEGREDDCFIEYMDIVFDSDSYNEMISKLKVMREASYLYSNGYVEDAKRKMEEVKYVSKDTYLNKVVGYPVNTMNKIRKPLRMIDRMKALYSKIDDSISYEFMDDIYSDSLSIVGFYRALDRSLDKRIEEAKKPFNMFKRKIKKRGFFNKGGE